MLLDLALACVAWLDVIPQTEMSQVQFLVGGVCLSCGFSPQSGRMQEATSGCFSFALMFLSLFLSFPLSGINKRNKFFKKTLLDLTIQSNDNTEYPVNSFPIKSWIIIIISSSPEDTLINF